MNEKRMWWTLLITVGTLGITTAVVWIGRFLHIW